MRHLRRHAVAVVLVGGLLAGCSGAPAHTPATARAVAGLTGEPHGIVILRAHHLGVLADLAGTTAVSPVPSGRPAPSASAPSASSEPSAPAAASAPSTPSPSEPSAPPAAPGAPVSPLAALRQLSATLVAGIRADGMLVALDPAHPAAVRVVAPAADWFPDPSGTGAWAVTEPNAPAGACPDLPHTHTQIPRYRLEHRDLADGAVERAPFLLPCGMRPVADTTAGFVVETVRPDTAPVAGDIVTDVRIADHATLKVKRQLVSSATVFAAANGTLLIDSTACRRGPCERPLVVGGGFRPHVGDLPRGGTLAGAGELDPTGRWLAAADYSPGNGGRLSLVLCDLRTGAVTALGAYRPASPGAAGLLQDDMPSLWSGSRFLYIDPATGTLTSYDTATGRSRTRTGLTAGGAPLQVWGAAH